MIALFPFMILGLIHCGLPYYFTKRLVEKSFKRRVFWSSIKMLLGQTMIGILNMPVFYLFYKFIYPSYWLALVYYLALGLFGLAAYMWFRNFKSYQIKGKMGKVNINKYWQLRTNLVDKIKNSIPIA